MAPRGFSVETLIEKYTGKRFGSWLVGDQFFRENKHWHVDVQCDCGKSHKVTIRSLATHHKCSCAYLQKVYENKLRAREKTELEKIWPSVVLAGRKVMEKYKNAMATI